MIKVSADEVNRDNVALHVGPVELNWKLAFSVRFPQLMDGIILN